jgi:hypothetical protein
VAGWQSTYLVAVEEHLLISSVQAFKQQHTLLQAAMPLHATLKGSNLFFHKGQEAFWSVPVPA